MLPRHHRTVPRVPLAACRAVRGRYCTSTLTEFVGNALGGVGGSLGGQVTHNRNTDPQFADAQYHVASTSPAVDTARPDFASFPDRDGVMGVRGAGADLGAYER